MYLYITYINSSFNPGKNRKNAIVITAHFDHVGSKDEMIWKGAIDNGTGTSALLDIAEKLKQHADKEELGQDIVFCAFNGEESLFQGSIPFVKDISTKYDNIYNINIDCVGLRNGGRLLVDGEGENNELIKTIISKFKDHGIGAYSDGEMFEGSDYLQFINSGINGVGLSQENIKDIIHTLEDTIDKVDIEYIEKLSEALVSFIIDNSEKTFKLLEDNSPQSVKLGKNLEDIVSEELNELKFNEYKYMEINGREELIKQSLGFFVGPTLFDDNHHKNRSLRDFYDLYPGFLLPENLGEYSLGVIYIYDQSQDYIENPELDKIYTLETKIDNINKIEFQYRDKLDNTILISIAIDEKNGDSRFNYQENQDNEISGEEVTIGNELYNSIYKKSNNELNGLYRKVEQNDRIYKIMITIPYDTDEWQYKTIEESIKAYKELNLSPFVEDILKVLMD